jgi:hypothetical protein
MMLILKINEMTRNDMVKIAEASPAKMTAEMAEFLEGLVKKGKYAKPTGDEFDMFDELFDAMEEAA